MNFVPVVLALALGTAGAPKSGKWVALVRTEGEVPASWTETLRRAAEAAKDDRVWVEPPAVTLVEAMSALGCAEWGPSCAGQVAQMTGATTALLVDVRAAGVSVALSAEAVLASGQPAKGRHEVTLPDTSDDSLRFAVAWVKGSLVDKLPALLIVETATPGAEVRLDGKRAGTTDAGAVRILVEAPGTHTLLVTKAGAAPVTRQVTLTPNATVRETVAMAAEAPPVDPTPRVGDGTVVTPPPPAEEPPAVADTTGAVVGWSLTGVGAVGALAAGVIAATVANDLYLARVPCGAGGQMSCVPKVVASPLGLYERRGEERLQFFNTEGPFYLGMAGLGVGVGVLLAATGAWFALAGPAAPTADEPAAP